jgi:hypothetical protein
VQQATELDTTSSSSSDTTSTTSSPLQQQQEQLVDAAQAASEWDAEIEETLKLVCLLPPAGE